jgi:hypothetical protein
MILGILLALAATGAAQVPDLETLEAELGNTHTLLQLYQQKLDLLQQLHRHHFPHHPLPSLPTLAPLSKSVRLSEHLVLLKQLDGWTTPLPPSYLLSGNRILNAEDYSEVGEFLGEVLLVEEDRVTTLVGGQLGMTVLRRKEGRVFKEELLLGQGAEAMESAWQRNFNIKDEEDILLQWQHDSLFLRGKEPRPLEFPREAVLGVYPLNQYKAAVVTSRQICILNTRSLSLGAPTPSANLTRLPHSDPDIVASCRQEATLLLLLSSG